MLNVKHKQPIPSLTSLFFGGGGDVKFITVKWTAVILPRERNMDNHKCTALLENLSQFDICRPIKIFGMQLLPVSTVIHLSYYQGSVHYTNAQTECLLLMKV